MKTLQLFCRLALAVVCSLALVAKVLGYGADGHETVGFIAAELIQGTPAEEKVNALLNGETLGFAATWADRAKMNHHDIEMTNFTAHNKQHHNYHYTDVPIQEGHYVDGKTGTSTNDIVHTMKQCMEVLQGHDTPQTNPHHFTPRIALLLLAHYVGDIHQPLHVGTAYIRKVNGKERFANPNVVTHGIEETLGGNFLGYKSGELHAYWDNNAVARAMSKAGAHTPEEYAQKILDKSPLVPETPGTMTDWPKIWADEMLPLATKAHRGFKLAPRITVTDHFGTHLQWKITPPSGYDDLARDTVNERITTAGFRLAQILHAIWP